MANEVSASEDFKPPSQSSWLVENYSHPKPDPNQSEIDLIEIKKIIPLRKVSPAVRLKTNPSTALFRKKFFPNTRKEEWNDWRWQIRNRVRSSQQLQTILDLSTKESQALQQPDIKLPVGITPYYLSLISSKNPFKKGQPP